MNTQPNAHVVQSSPGPRIQSHLRVGIEIKDLNSFSHALIEYIQTNDPGLIADDRVEYCALNFANAKQCFAAIQTSDTVADILGDALNETVEQCKQTLKNGPVCDGMGALFGDNFARG